MYAWLADWKIQRVNIWMSVVRTSLNAVWKESGGIHDLRYLFFSVSNILTKLIENIIDSYKLHEKKK